MESIIYIFLGLLGFGLLVFLHELGHYIVAKREGMVVEVFSIGFGKPILKWKFQGVDWQIGILPFGGFVKIKGMEGDSKNKIHEEKDSFFGANPLSRLKVAVAGPLVNIVLAFVFFSAIWFMGGREKAFSENTRIVGFVEKDTKLEKLGLKPGDKIEQVGDRFIHNFNELLESAVIAGDNVRLIGYHVEPQSGDKIPFDLNYSLKLDPDQFQKSLRKARAILPANYLTVQKQSDGNIQNFSGSPLADLNIQDQDRLLWVDGQIIYSPSQLHEILEKRNALVTVQRGEEVFLVQVPRVLENLLYMPSEFSNEVGDWKYEMGMKAKKTYLLPYSFDKEGTILHRIPYNKPMVDSLKKGDKILAIDGVKMNSGLAILQALQTHKVSLIVQRAKPKVFDWQTQDETFENSLEREKLYQLTHRLGLTEKKNNGDLHLIEGIVPKNMLAFAKTDIEKEQLNKQIAESRKAILQMRDPDKRKESLALLEEELQRPMLGIAFQEKMVPYNPNPVRSFVSVYQSTFRTLKSLIVGNISPKFLSGPVGMMQVMHRSFSISIKEGLFWLGIISLNLGILNLLPIPVLDGGYIFISMYEITTRKRVGQKALQKLMLPFFILIIFMFVFSTFHDLSRLWQSIT